MLAREVWKDENKRAESESVGWCGQGVQSSPVDAGEDFPNRAASSIESSKPESVRD